MANQGKYAMEIERVSRFRAMLDRVRGWSRAKKALAGAGVVVVAAATVAVAVLLFRAPIDGEVQVNGEQEVKWLTAETAELSEGAADCTVALNGETLVVTISDALPGSSCAFRPTLDVVGAHDVVVTDITFNSADLEVRHNKCGAVIPADAGSGQYFIDFEVHIPPDTPTGTYVADAEAGLQAVLQSEFTEDMCPTP